MKQLDNFLNNITMYRLVLYYLILLVVVGGFYNSTEYFFTALVVLGTCLAFNKIFAAIFRAPANFESVYITALILILIIHPLAASGWPTLILVSFMAIASKFILAVNKKHIFNPAAMAVFLSALFAGYSATWWVGNPRMLPFVLLGGFLVIRKIKRFDLAISFLATATILTVLRGFSSGLVASPIWFFASIMLTEPQTTPPTRKLRILYGILVGVLFSTTWNIGPIYATPEAALIVGNIFSYLVSPKHKLILKLKKRVLLAPSIHEFVFSPKRDLKYEPGQYMEWTLAHNRVDSRGNRRFFTLASSPTEEDIKIGVKFSDNSSSFKRKLLQIGNQNIVASQITGDFTLPRNKKQKLVFIAGGIGVTPFRSMIKYLVDKNEKQDVVFFYTAKNEAEFVYKDIFDEAGKKLGLKTFYVATEKEGRLDEKKIKNEVADYKERMFYLSGPHTMVEAFKETLSKMGVTKIKTDYFPGYA